MTVIEELNRFYARFSGEKGYIGLSARKKPIYYFKSGFGKPVIVAQYSIHAREYITTYLALSQLLNYSGGGTAYFIPMTNPDGVEIALKEDPLYKANANGVDLNVNFDAEWGKGISNKREKGPSDYIGESPFSEPESKALRDFTLYVRPDVTISYHSKGREIYYRFNQTGEEEKRDRRIASILASSTGYAVKTPFGSVGGYKDWCIDKLHIPSFTIEVGGDELVHPIGKEHLKKIQKENEEVFYILSREIK